MFVYHLLPHCAKPLLTLRFRIVFTFRRSLFDYPCYWVYWIFNIIIIIIIWIEFRYRWKIGKHILSDQNWQILSVAYVIGLKIIAMCKQSYWIYWNYFQLICLLIFLKMVKKFILIAYFIGSACRFLLNIPMNEVLLLLSIKASKKV